MSVPAVWYPKAKRVPLDFVSELPKLTPLTLVMHTNGGKKQPDTPRVAVHLAGWFNGRFHKTGERLAAHMQFMRNGKIEQYVPFDKQAYAQFKGNTTCISCEFEDDGDPNRPLTAEQVAAFVEFAAWTGIPPRLVKTAIDSGIGYHQQFREWNQSGHNCPGSVRVHQLTQDIIPAIIRRRNPAPHPTSEPHRGDTVNLTFPVLDEHDRGEGPYPFSAVTQTAQCLLNAAMRRRGVTAYVAEDGKFGAATTEAVVAFQRHEKLDDDGVIGAKTWTHLLGLG